MRLKLIYTTTFTILFQILPSQPMTYEVVDHGTMWSWIALNYVEIDR